MYLDIAVAAAKDPAKNVFTYFSDKALVPGTLVSVPFGPKKSQGVVVAKKTASPVKNILPVLRVLFPFPILTEQQLVLLSWVAETYHASLSATIALALPDFPVGIIKGTPLLPRSNLPPLPQTLILAPSTAMVEQIAQQYQTKYQDLIRYHSDQTPTERAAAYLDVRLGNTPIVVATRAGVYLPFANLSRILLYNEHDWGYKEIRTPTYHTTIVAERLAQLAHVPLQIRDNSPRLQTLYHLSKTKPANVSLTQAFPDPKPPVSVIDLKNEQKKGNTTLIAERVAEQIEAALAQKQPVLLFLNKRADGGMYFCRQCQFSQYFLEKPASCPQCGAETGVFSVANLKAVAHDLSRHLYLWGYKTVKWQTNMAGSALTFSNHDRICVTVATQKILYTASPRSFALGVVVLGDTLLSLPEFRASEKAYSTISDLIRLVSPSGRFFIQTKQIDHPVFRFCSQDNFRGFAKAELADRKQLGYPPFSSLVLLSFSAKTAATVTKNVGPLMDQFAQLSTSDQNQVEVVGPFEPLRNSLEARILLKGTSLPVLTRYLALVPSKWKIDFDPENILT